MQSQVGDRTTAILLKKYKIVTNFLGQLDDSKICSLMAKSELKAKYPFLVSQLSDHRLDDSGIRINKDQTISRLNDAMRRKCLQILRMLGNDPAQGDSVDGQVAKELKDSLDMLNCELTEFKKLGEEIKTVEAKAIESYKTYLNLLKEYLENYVIPFKLPYDDKQVDHICGKVQVLYIKRRHEGTEEIYKLYGNKAIIDELKSKRRGLEKEETQLKFNTNAATNKLNEYHDLNPESLKTYLELKKEFTTLEWAANELNVSDRSF